MKNTESICALARQTGLTASKIEHIVKAITIFEHEEDQALASAYVGFALDELEHLQRSAIEITRLISSQVPVVVGNNKDEGDTSAFAEGDLNSVKGKKKENYNKEA